MSENKANDGIYYIIPTFWASVISGVAFVATPAAIIGIGWALDSAAMEWVGFVVSMLVILGRSKAYMQRRRMDPQQAADRLLAEFGVTGREGAWKQ